MSFIKLVIEGDGLAYYILACGILGCLAAAVAVVRGWLWPLLVSGIFVVLTFVLAILGRELVSGAAEIAASLVDAAERSAIIEKGSHKATHTMSLAGALTAIQVFLAAAALKRRLGAA